MQPGYTDLVANFPLFRAVAESDGAVVAGTPGTAVMEALAPYKGDVVLTHSRVSCFQGTVLDVVLRGAGIDTVVLAGVATNVAVESTARAGADLGYRVLVVSDATSATSQTAHDASLAMFAEIVPADSLLTAFDKNSL